MGRAHIFGDSRHLEYDHPASWTCLVRRSAVITGFHIDSHFGFGVTSTPTSDAARKTVPVTIDVPVLLPPSNPNTCYVLKTASTNSIIRLHIKRDKSYCKGLLIERHDGTFDVLGKWNPVDLPCAETIYDGSTERRPLTGILVRMAKFGVWRRVRSVAALVGDTTPPRGYKVYRDTASKPRQMSCGNFVNGITRLWHGGGMRIAT